MHDFQSDIDAIARIDAIPTILDVVCRTTGLGFAAIARVTEERWVTCQVLDSLAFGLAIGDELEVETTICHEVRQHANPVVINNVSESEGYQNHHTPQKYGFESYISVPITLKDGRFFGTLCALDPKPAMLENPETIGMFSLFAQLIAAQLDADAKLLSTEQRLGDEQKMAEFREQFIAVLGHDLRNPIASIDAGTRVLGRTQLDDRALMVVELIQGSVKRMADLVDDLLDFARGRLGDGLAIDRQVDEPLLPVLNQVVAELQSTHSDNVIESDFSFTDPIDCDPSRIGQMLSNLLGNALAHGADGAPVRVAAKGHGEQFELAVYNSGAPIDSEAMKSLFQPFFRAAARPSQQGLGLGLYIASEIARAHGGKLQAESDTDQTVFRFVMPLYPQAQLS